jgi:hypothetical protein
MPMMELGAGHGRFVARIDDGYDNYYDVIDYWYITPDTKLHFDGKVNI